MIMSVRVLVRKEKLGNTEKKWKLGGEEPNGNPRLEKMKYLK